MIELVLLDLLPFRMPSVGVGSGRLCERFSRAGVLGAFVLGVLFALAMCPPSAALFFGGLVPMSVERSLPFLLPLVFGFATALPVIVAAVLLAYSANGLGCVFGNVARIERVFRLLTGAALLVYGLVKCCSVLIG